MRIINKAIREEYIKYALPVYDLTYTSVDSFSDTVLTINSESLLEAMLLRLRGESIKYASNAKRKQNNLENILKADIKKLESESDDNPSDILEIKKMQLEEIRNERMKGQWVHSCSQWNIEGEKPSNLVF